MGYIKTDFTFEFYILELCRNHINCICFFCFKKSHPVATIGKYTDYTGPIQVYI